MTFAEVDDAPDSYENGFTTGPQLPANDLNDFLGLMGIEGNYVRLANQLAACKSIDKNTGHLVRRLAIPYFLKLSDIQQFAQHCPNLEYLDIASFIDACDVLGGEDPVKTIPDVKQRLTWSAIVKAAPELFTNLRSIKICRLAPVDREARCLELQERIGVYDRCFDKPKSTRKLLDDLTKHPATTLTELRLDSMLLSVRSLPYFLRVLGKARPGLRKVCLSLNKDLTIMSGMNPRWGEHRNLPSSDKDVEVWENTPKTCWDYIRKLKEVSMITTANGEAQFSLSSLDQHHDLSIHPEALFSNKDLGEASVLIVQGDDTNSLYQPSRVEPFQWLKEELDYVPTFDWSRQINHTDDHYDGDPSCLHQVPEAARDLTLQHCRELFNEVKDAGIPVKLLLATENQKDEGSPWYTGSFFLPEWTPTMGRARRNAPTLDLGHHRPEQWYLHRVGDLVDHLQITWGHLFLRETWKSPSSRRRRGDTSYLNEPSQRQRAQREKQAFRQFFSALAHDFPNLSRLDLHIPAMIYLGDEKFMNEYLPGTGWKKEIGKFIAIKDLRTCGVKPQADVVFLNRVFTREVA